MAGILYLCATPIGNLEDMTYRAVRILQEADLIAAEDTRNSAKLLQAFDIHTPMTSYHHYNRYDKIPYLLRLLQEGKNIALITDAGMPGISDPGEELVKACIEAGVRVTPVPGASAGLSALVCSGLPAGEFCFEGFLPTEKKEQQQRLERLAEEDRTMIFYEAPHRLAKTLELLYAAFGDRKIAVCRELTKKHEEFTYTGLQAALTLYQQQEPKGEFVLIVQGRDRKQMDAQEQEAFLALPLEAHMKFYTDQGIDRKEAMKLVAKDRGISRRDVYAALIHE